LEAGGNVVFIALQYPEMEFVQTSLKRLCDLNVDEYPKNIAYIQFDHDIDTYGKSGENVLKANMLKPDIRDKAISEAENLLARGVRNKFKRN